MALMIRYCKAHRYSWAIIDGANCCAYPDHDRCEVVSADAIPTINTLGREVEAAEEEADEE